MTILATTLVMTTVMMTNNPAGKIKAFKIINMLPVILEGLIHFVGSLVDGFTTTGLVGEIGRDLIVTVLAMVLGEGYAAIMFLIAGIYQRKVLYGITIGLCFLSAIASFVGYALVDLGGRGVLPITVSFAIIDTIILILSIVEMVIINRKSSLKIH